MKNPGLREYFSDCSVALDIDAITKQFTSLTPRYDFENWKLPLPPWAMRPYDNDGTQAWQHLVEDLHGARSENPMCVYLHIPFCSNKCGFCDSYSFKLGSHVEENMNSYVDQLCQEMTIWKTHCVLENRPISTIHLGGGSPTYLRSHHLERLVFQCQQLFKITPNTEWALESTAHDLTPVMLSNLHKMEFRRLHVGVQSLQDDVREKIGRQSPAARVIETISNALDLGWVVSVDLIVGLPGQTMKTFLEDILKLVSLGVNGFSIYELLIYPQNSRWAVSYGLDKGNHLVNYLMFQAGAMLLKQHGFRQNLFNHWSDALDKNVYFTSPSRGEDLLAIGAIADGVFGSYHYRHPTYAKYMKAGHEGIPNLQGGLRRTNLEEKFRGFSTELLSAHISESKLAGLKGLRSSQGQPLLDTWSENALVETDGFGGLALTTNGAWFAGNMTSELFQALQAIDLTVDCKESKPQ